MKTNRCKYKYKHRIDVDIDVDVEVDIDRYFGWGSKYTFGPKVCKDCLLWATWIPRVPNHRVDAKKSDHEPGTIYAGLLSSLVYFWGLEDGHIPTFWLLL